MTRENKVALVVGFALVLFVGILISDHFSRARVRPADLILAADPAPPGAPAREILDVRREVPSINPAPAPQPAAAAPAAMAPVPAATADPLGPAATQTAAAPAPPAAPTAAAAAPGDPAIRMHEVRPGESLSTICQRYYGNQGLVEKLAAFNGIDDPDSIWGGARIKVPGVEVLNPRTPAAPAAQAERSAKVARYQVRDGDTLCSIAERVLRSRSRWKQLYEANREVITDPDNIRPGSVLQIPAG
jgi:nucleoid-associated protein YgaU